MLLGMTINRSGILLRERPEFAANYITSATPITRINVDEITAAQLNSEGIWVHVVFHVPRLSGWVWLTDLLLESDGINAILAKYLPGVTLESVTSLKK